MFFEVELFCETFIQSNAFELLLSDRHSARWMKREYQTFYSQGASLETCSVPSVLMKYIVKNKSVMMKQ